MSKTIEASNTVKVSKQAKQAKQDRKPAAKPVDKAAATATAIAAKAQVSNAKTSKVHPLSVHLNTMANTPWGKDSALRNGATKQALAVACLMAVLDIMDKANTSKPLQDRLTRMIGSGSAIVDFVYNASVLFIYSGGGNKKEGALLTSAERECDGGYITKIGRGCIHNKKPVNAKVILASGKVTDQLRTQVQATIKAQRKNLQGI